MFASLQSFIQDTKWGLYQNLESDLHDLLYLFWEATRQCNLNCRHCGSDCSKDSHPGLPAQVVTQTLERIASVYSAQDIVLVVTGGEPLVRPDLFDVLKIAARLGFRLGMVTNGISVSKPMAKRLAEAHVDNIVVSLDGPKETHDWLRNRDGAFERACRGIENLLEAGVPFVEAITCATPKSLEQLDETYRIVKDLGAHAWRIFNIFPAGRAKNDPELLLTDAQLARLIENVARLRAIGQAEGFPVNLSEEGFLGWDWESRVRDSPYFCRAGINIAGLMADGAIAACPNLPTWMNQGNVLHDDFIDVWEQGYRLFRNRSWTKQGACATCSKWNVCRGNSLHLWRTPDGGPSWCHYQILHPDTDLQRSFHLPRPDWLPFLHLQRTKQKR
ncbi:MAG: radical SAM protein [Deltaproteobacteria bacterium]|nr:radical SAM protein [Deltaproteobacteria bacterium]